MNLKGSALAYAARGLPVFPLHTPQAEGHGCSCKGGPGCSSPGKHPRTKNGFKDATTDKQQIEDWWTKWADANIGIRTGRASGWLVLDVDKEKGGFESLQESGLDSLPDTLTAETGSGGFHIIFEYPSADEIRNATGILPGVDIRGEGGYIVAAPSGHRSGEQYKWLEETVAASVPDWLFALIDKSRKSDSSGKNADPIKEGQRNDALFRHGCSLRAKGADPEQIHNQLLILNEKRCEPRLDGAEVQKIAQSSSRYEPGSGKSVEEILTTVGVDSLTTDSKPEEVEAVLRLLIHELEGADALRLSTLREATVRKLKDIGIKSPTAMIDAALHRIEPKEKKDSPAFLTDPEPWPKRIGGRKLADKIALTFQRHVVLPPHGEVLMTLWTVFTYIYDYFHIAPILGVTSPQKRCGKTIVLEILSSLVRRPLPASNITTSAVFRAIDVYQPTLLVDEADTFMRQNEELRGVLNSGHRRSAAFVVRSVPAGDDYVPKIFSTWAPKAIALIGRLPETLEDRAIVLPMQRKTIKESVLPLGQGEAAELGKLRQKIARWVMDHKDDLLGAKVEPPKELHDRARDNWNPLLIIAQALGGDWPEKARMAANQLSPSVEDDSVGVMLLEDIKTLFEEEQAEAIKSRNICSYLAELEHRPWGEYRKGKPVSVIQVARIIKPFNIRPQQLNIDGKNPRGYLKKDFEDAWNRYLSSDDPSPDPLKPLRPRQDKDLSQTEDPLDPDDPSGLKSGGNTDGTSDQAGQAGQKGKSQGKGKTEKITHLLAQEVQKRAEKFDFMPRTEAERLPKHTTELPAAPKIDPSPRGFYSLVQERHAIHQRRHIQKLPRPWTTDPILQRKRFCNTFRIHDKVTHWLIKNVIEPNRKKPMNLVWQTAVARIINRVETLEFVGLPDGRDFKPDGLLSSLDHWVDQGGKICSPVGIWIHGFKGQSRQQTITQMLTAIHTAIKKEDFVNRLREVQDLEAAWNLFRGFYNLGSTGFVAFQICWDISYSNSFWKSAVRGSQFRYAGPGAIGGLAAVFGKDHEGLSYTGQQDPKWTNLLIQLHGLQDEYLPKDFPRLDLWTVQHMSCELRKYLAIKKDGKKGHNFTPSFQE